MSGLLMGHVYEIKLSHGQQAVLLAMADHAKDDGSHCFPSVGFLAWKTDYNERHVKRLLSELREARVLVEIAPASHEHPTEYRIDLSAATSKAPFVAGNGRARVPEGIRWEVWERDNFTCRGCGTRRNLSIDHITPVSKGGETVKDNLQTLCGTCNSRKSTRGDIRANMHEGVTKGVTPIAPEPLEPSVEPPTTICDESSETDRGADVNGNQSDSPAAALAAAEAGGDGQTSLTIGSDRDIDAEVDQLWTHYVAEFDPPHKKLSASRARAIRKGFKEEFTLAQLKRAVSGLKIWRRTKPGNESIGAIFTTYPGSDNLADRISFFIEVAEKAGIAGHITSADPAIVQQRQLDVQRGHRSTSPDQVQAAEEAEEWLRQHGIETVRNDDGYPTFRHGGGA